MESDHVEFVSRTVSRRHAVEAMLVSAMTLQLYDWLLVLPQEVKYVWCASRNWSKALYLLTRYIPFITIALVFRNHFSPNPTPESCKRTLHAISWLAFIGLDLAEIVLALRTYVVWNGDKRVGIGLALLLGLHQIPNAILLYKFVEGIGFIENQYPEIYGGCAYNHATRLIFVDWIMLSVVEGVVLVLMTISAVKTCQPSPRCVPTVGDRSLHEHTSNLMHVVYRDGIRFYLFTFCVTLTNVLITLLLPTDFITIGSDIEIVLHSSLACRLMIGIREASQSSVYTSETLEHSGDSYGDTLEFARRPSGESA